MQVVLGRWCRQEHVVIGLPYSGRTKSQLEGLVGNFINMLPIRSSLPPDTSFQTLLRSVQQSITDALSHSELPFNKLVEAMGVSRSADRTPIFQVVVDLLEESSSARSQALVKGPVEPPVSIPSSFVTLKACKLLEPLPSGLQLHAWDPVMMHVSWWSQSLSAQSQAQRVDFIEHGQPFLLWLADMHLDLDIGVCIWRVHDGS